MPTDEANMQIKRYREIVYGFVFGLGACAIDIVMHARMDGRSALEELIRPDPAMIFYRVLFLAFGIALGMLLWQKSKREREARQLAELMRQLRHDIAGPTILIHANVQMLLTREGSAAAGDAEPLLRVIYEQSKKLRSVIGD